MDMDLSLQVVAAKFATSYLDKAIYDIDKRIDISPTDDYKAELIAIKRLYKVYLKELKEWLDS